MEDVLFHATLISDITYHSKFMDMDFVYKAFMSCIVVAADAVACLFCLLLFFCQALRSTMPSSDHSPRLSKLIGHKKFKKFLPSPH